MSGINKHSIAITQGRFDFDRIIGTKERVFALFYATWCPFSLKFLPLFEKHAEAKGRACVRLTIDDKASLFDRYNVEVMPTVIFFKNGKVAKRLDSPPGVGLNEKQLIDLLKSCK
jgi:thioredoxin 1